MRGQKAEFFVVVEDRRACRRAVVGQAKALGNFLVDARQAQQVGMFGPDDRDRLRIAVVVVAVEREHQAIAGARQVGHRAHGGVGNAGHDAPQRGAHGAAFVFRQEKHVEIRPLRHHADRHARDARQARAEAGDIVAVGALVVIGHAVAEHQLHVDRLFPAMQPAGRLPGDKAAAVVGIFLEQGDADEVFHQLRAAERRIGAAAVGAQQALGQKAVLHTLVIVGQFAADRVHQFHRGGAAGGGGGRRLGLQRRQFAASQRQRCCRQSDYLLPPPHPISLWERPCRHWRRSCRRAPLPRPASPSARPPSSSVLPRRRRAWSWRHRRSAAIPRWWRSG